MNLEEKFEDHLSYLEAVKKALIPGYKSDWSDEEADSSDSSDDEDLTEEEIPYITFTLDGNNIKAYHDPDNDETYYTCFSTTGGDKYYFNGSWYKEGEGDIDEAHIESAMTAPHIYQKQNDSFIEIDISNLDYNFQFLPV